MSGSIILDATVSVQHPGGRGSSSSGPRELIPVLVGAACALGVDALFIETHEDPDNAPSDGPNMVPVAEMGRLLAVLSATEGIVKQMLQSQHMAR